MPSPQQKKYVTVELNPDTPVTVCWSNLVKSISRSRMWLIELTFILCLLILLFLSSDLMHYSAQIKGGCENSSLRIQPYDYDQV